MPPFPEFISPLSLAGGTGHHLPQTLLQRKQLPGWAFQCRLSELENAAAANRLVSNAASLTWVPDVTRYN